MTTNEEKLNILRNQVYMQVAECKDSVVMRVVYDLLTRSIVGQKKYGQTLDRADLTIKQWQNHLYEELLDAANYLKKITHENQTD